jgi:hypothetical protein
MKHRILTLVLALALLLGLVCATGITASAAAASEVTIAGVTSDANGDFDFAGEDVEVEGTANYKNGVLTLTNFHYTGSETTLLSADGDLTITLVGDNTITNDHYGSVNVFTIDVTGKLTIQGEGSLSVVNTGAITGTNDHNVAILSNGLEVKCAKLEAIAQSSAKGNSYGIDSGSSAIVLGATSQLIAKGYSAAWTSDNEGSNYLPEVYDFSKNPAELIDIKFGQGEADTHFVNTSTEYSATPDVDRYNAINEYQYMAILPAVHVSIYDSETATIPTITKWVYGEEMPTPNHPTVDGSIFKG